MRFTSLVRLSILIAVLALPADALAASGIRTSSVTGRLVVSGGSPSTMRLHCAPSAVALNGAVTRRGAGVAILGSSPGRDAGSWRFRAAASGAGSRSLSAVLRCVSLRLPDGFTHARIAVKTRRTTDVVVAPGATGTARAGCGSRWTATGYALDAGRSGDVRLADVVPGRHGWRFTLENTGAAPARATVSTRCLRSKTTASAPGGETAELRFRMGHLDFTSSLAGEGRQTETVGCADGRFSVATGSSVDSADSIELVTASPVRRRLSRWVFQNVTPGDRYTGHVLCLRTGSRFH
jgi:hypothetical protein